MRTGNLQKKYKWLISNENFISNQEIEIKIKFSVANNIEKKTLILFKDNI